MKFIILTTGLPSSGKSTYCHKLHCETGIRVVSYDSFLDNNDKKMAGDREFFFRVVRAMESSGCAIVDWIASTRQRREGFLDMLGKRFRFHTVCIYFPLTMEQALHRRNRTGQGRLKSLREMFDRFEPPEEGEKMELLRVENSFGGIPSDFVRYLKKLQKSGINPALMADKQRQFQQPLTIRKSGNP